MARLEVLYIAPDDQLPQAWLEAFKQYASIPDDGRDALLLGILKTALLRVQEYADRALLRCHIRQVCHSDAKTGEIRLYLGGGGQLTTWLLNRAESVSNQQKTADIAVVPVRDADIVAEFDTDPHQGWLVQARPTVFRLATAIYDGESVDVCNSILNEVL